MSRALDAECATALRYEVVYSAYNGEIMGVVDTSGAAHNLAAYSSDHATARLLEDEIERRGKRNAYLTHLFSECGTHVLDCAYPDDVWNILRATPEQRARAFLKAIA